MGGSSSKPPPKALKSAFGGAKSGKGARPASPPPDGAWPVLAAPPSLTLLQSESRRLTALCYL